MYPHLSTSVVQFIVLASNFSRLSGGYFESFVSNMEIYLITEEELKVKIRFY